MTKLAILNSRLFDPQNKEVLNLLIENNSLIGKGYLPDDDNSYQINAPKSMIFTDITDLNITPLSEKKHYETGSITQTDSIHPKITPQVILENELDEFIDTCLTQETTPITACSGSELLYVILECEKRNCPLHVIIKNPETDYPITQCYKDKLPSLTISLQVPHLKSTYKTTLIAAIKYGSIHSLCSLGESQNLIEACLLLTKEGIPLDESLPLITLNPRKLLKLETKGLTLNSAPNITLVNTEKGEPTSEILVCIDEGKLVYNTLS